MTEITLIKKSKRKTLFAGMLQFEPRIGNFFELWKNFRDAILWEDLECKSFAHDFVPAVTESFSRVTHDRKILQSHFGFFAHFQQSEPSIKITMQTVM